MKAYMRDLNGNSIEIEICHSEVIDTSTDELGKCRKKTCEINKAIINSVLDELRAKYADYQIIYDSNMLMNSLIIAWDEPNIVRQVMTNRYIEYFDDKIEMKVYYLKRKEYIVKL